MVNGIRHRCDWPGCTACLIEDYVGKIHDLGWQFRDGEDKIVCSHHAERSQDDLHHAIAQAEADAPPAKSLFSMGGGL